MSNKKSLEPLHADIELLQRLLLQVLQELAPRHVAARVAAITHAALSSDPSTAGRPDHLMLQQLLRDCPDEHQGHLLRALAQMLSHINLAERVHRLRRRRASFDPSASPQEGSLLAVARAEKSRGATAAQAKDAAQALQLHPIFTAHPTEATRGSLLRKEQRMAQLLLEEGASVSSAKEDGLKSEMATAWQTETLTDAPTVADEVEHVTFYLTHVIYPVVPTFFEGLRDAIAKVYGQEAAASYGQEAQNRGPDVRFGTWVGGDMDGNPNVGPKTLQGTLETQRSALIAAYNRDLRALYDRLSQSESRTQVTETLKQKIADYRIQAPQVLPSRRHENMPYRLLISHIMARLQALLDAKMADGVAPYKNATELFDDLRAIADSLDAHSGRFGGGFAVRRLMRRVATFDLHLAALDVRQDSAVHKEAAAALLDDPSLTDAATTPADRCAIYARAIEQCAAGTPPFSKEAMARSADAGTVLGRTLAVFAAIAAARERFGEGAIGLYIISMAQDADDLLVVLLLAHAAGLTRKDGRGNVHVALQVAPLFETVPDLQRSADVFAALCHHATWQQHLAAQNNTQHVMLGYSDSNKESGFVASRTALLLAEAQLLAVAAKHRVTLKLFHGRGGTASRGGTKPRAAILASQDTSPRLRLTEQGEIINAKYGLEPLVQRTLELMGGALWQRHMSIVHKDADVLQTDHHGAHALLRACADKSREVYQKLTKDTPGFFDYFNLATPIDVIIQLRIGSRPPSRRACQGLQDLRAIPWVFAWMQNRQMLPAWYGLGEGLAHAAHQASLKELRDLYKTWPYFTNLIDDACVGLAKCDMAIGARYAALAKASLAPIWAGIEASHAQAQLWVCDVIEQQQLLAHAPVLQQSIERRNPLIAPMSLMQLQDLTAWRAGHRQDDRLLQRLMLSVKGIAKGLHNTG